MKGTCRLPCLAADVDPQMCSLSNPRPTGRGWGGCQPPLGTGRQQGHFRLILVVAHAGLRDLVRTAIPTSSAIDTDLRSVVRRLPRPRITGAPSREVQVIGRPSEDGAGCRTSRGNSEGHLPLPQSGEASMAFRTDLCARSRSEVARCQVPTRWRFRASFMPDTLEASAQHAVGGSVPRALARSCARRRMVQGLDSSRSCLAEARSESWIEREPSMHPAGRPTQVQAKDVLDWIP